VGLFKVSRTPSEQAARDVRISNRNSHRSLDDLREQLRAVGDLGLDLDETARSPAARQKVDVATLLRGLTIATETAEQALAEVIALRAELAGS
jgi:hypothetical protein